MPTVLNEDGFQYIIFTKDHPPAHVHVKHGDNAARIQLVPVAVMDSFGFNSRELNKILLLTRENQQLLLEVWDSFHPVR